ncbi:hypothetical protein S40285_10781 [Stachybotrys chlorohalonatus IBT 40285]|uniref:Uncharacterized protein n=1 Tax=Stachybotrys chlorohalonatus (strain IBT 40285) TaxID=1283841 RepID=A0A084QX33_STAC4|nr:hypothetical protein S40285_10781 [Stachybotrys chlorohalonata IBT 40285]
MAGFRELTFLCDACPDDIELRGLLASPEGAFSCLVLLALPSLDIVASLADDILGPAPSTSIASTLPQPTDLCSSGCPDDTCSILLLDPPSFLAPEFFRLSRFDDILLQPRLLNFPDHHRPYWLHAALADLCSFGCPDKTDCHRLPDLLGPRHPRRP